MRGIEVMEPPTVERLNHSFAAKQLRVWRIDLAAVHSKASLLDAIGGEIGFPQYFRNNWDSLEECLRDLGEEKGWVLMFEHADRLLSLPRTDLAALIGILNDTAAFWDSEGRIFKTAFVGTSTFAEEFETLTNIVTQ